MDTKQLQAMRLLQSANVKLLKPEAKKQIAKLQGYVQVRKWQYTTMAGLVAIADESGDRATKRILLDGEGNVVGMNDTPVAVMYLLGNQVAAYVMISTHTRKLVAMHLSSVERLPPSHI